MNWKIASKLRASEGITYSTSSETAAWVNYWKKKLSYSSGSYKINESQVAKKTERNEKAD